MHEQSSGIAVFGSSEPLPGEPLYEQARELGRRLAEAGFAVITGGYGGVMEAASRGAREAGGHAVGVTCAVFSARRPNRWLSEERQARDLYDRTRELIGRARGFVVLEGKAGTLAELAFLWALERAGCLDGRPVVLLGESWERLVDELTRCDMLERQQIEATRFAPSPAGALQVLKNALNPPRRSR